MKRNIEDKKVGYLPDTANELAIKRKAKYKLKVNKHSEIKEMIIDKLKRGWSPMAIAGRMKLEKVNFRTSHETIYKFIYSVEGAALELFKCLLIPKNRHRIRIA